jgi:serine/threonine protein kinase
MSRKDALSEYMRAQHLGLERIDPAQEYMIYPIFNCELELSSYEGDCPITGTVLDTLLFSRNGGRELFKVVLEVTTFDRAQALVYAFMRVFATIQLLHDHEIYHLDLKLPNMLIDRSDTIRVIDFGLSASLDDLVTSYAPVFDNPYVYWPIETVLLAKPIRGHRAILKYIRAMNADRFIKHVFPPNWLEQYVNWAWFANQYQSLRQPSTRRAAVKTIAEAVEVYSLGMIIRQYFASHSFGSRIYGLLPASVQTDIRTLASEMLSIDITQRLTLPAATQRWRALCMQYNVRLKI